MKYDLDLTFGEIFNDDPDAFLDQLIDIQKHQATREESEKWVDQLRFIDISGVPDLREENNGKCISYIGDSTVVCPGQKKPLILPLLEKKDDDGSTQYLAVSWRWINGKQLPKWGCDVRESFDYMIQRPGKEPHKSEFPDHYFERVILYAQDEGIDRLWIDKECIYQRYGDDPNDRPLGVQIMDVVYGDSMFSVGLLTTSLMHQHEIDLLAELLSGAIFRNPNDTINPQYKRNSKADTEVLQVQTLILRILSDSRWSRGWIFQEDHLASHRMILLIPYTKSLNPRTALYSFGTIPGNLKVKLSAFRRSVTMFCMASNESEYRWPLSEMLGKAKQYNIFNKKLNQIGSNPREYEIHASTSGSLSKSNINRKGHSFKETTYPSSTHSLLDDICHRDLEKMEDRIPIMANAAKFSKRLNTSPESPLVTSEDYSLSTVLMNLILINGEIMNTAQMSREENLMGSTLLGLLQKWQYRFSTPLLKYEQSFIDHCRLKGSVITRGGVEAQGFLFKLLPNRKPFAASSKPHPLKLTDGDRKRFSGLIAEDSDAEKIAPGRKFSLLAEEIILILTSKLRKNYGKRCRLADFLEENLEWDRRPPPPEEAKPSTPYVLNMIAGVIQALINDRELRFAILDGEPETAQPSAVFIAPFQNDGWVSEQTTSIHNNGVGHSFVFTSWDNGWRNHSMERLACIEVAAFKSEPFEVLSQWDPDQADNAYLQSYSWINGVWVGEGKRMSRYTFPITGLTAPRSRPIEDILGKRKRDDGDDEDNIEDTAASSRQEEAN